MSLSLKMRIIDLLFIELGFTKIIVLIVIEYWSTTKTIQVTSHYVLHIHNFFNLPKQTCQYLAFNLGNTRSAHIMTVSPKDKESCFYWVLSRTNKRMREWIIHSKSTLLLELLTGTSQKIWNTLAPNLSNIWENTEITEVNILCISKWRVRKFIGNELSLRST